MNLEERLKPLEKPAKAALLVGAITAGVIGAAGIAAGEINPFDNRSECEKQADALYDTPSPAKAQFTRFCEATPDD